MKIRLLLADRVKGRSDSFLAPLMPALEANFEARFVSSGPGDALADAIAWADVVWLEWCWDHAVWATQDAIPPGKPCIVRLHSIEALQTDYPARVNWDRVTTLVTVADDITDLLLAAFPGVTAPIQIIPNGIDMAQFKPGKPDRFRVGWVGHLEPKKNPMLMMQIAHALWRRDSRFSVHVAGAFTDLRTARYLKAMQAALGLAGVVRFDGHVNDMPTWYADKGVLLSTSMYESFGMNIGEAMATGAFPVVHGFPGSDRLWPPECLFASVDEAVALIQAARPGLYRDWVAGRYGLDLQTQSILSVIRLAFGKGLAKSPSLAAAITERG